LGKGNNIIPTRSPSGGGGGTHFWTKGCEGEKGIIVVDPIHHEQVRTHVCPEGNSGTDGFLETKRIICRAEKGKGVHDYRGKNGKKKIRKEACIIPEREFDQRERGGTWGDG